MTAMIDNVFSNWSVENGKNTKNQVRVKMTAMIDNVFSNWSVENGKNI